MPIYVAYFSILVEEEGRDITQEFLFTVQSFACVGVITFRKQVSFCRKKCIRKTLIFITFEELTITPNLLASWTI